MLLFSKICYNMLMKRKALKIDFKILSRYVLILGVAVGVLMTANGVLQIKSYKEKVGDRSLEEVTEEFEPLSYKLGTIKREKTAEYDKNGYSDKYNQLVAEEAEIESKVSSLADSKYMKETGYHNPHSLSEYFETAPTLIIGLLSFAVGIVAFIVLRKIDLEKTRSERKAAKEKE